VTDDTSGRQATQACDTAAELAAPLAAAGTPRAYPKRTVIFQEGDESDHVFVVLSGRLKVFLANGDGREIVLDILGPGQFFGEMTLDGGPRSASVMTLEPSRLSLVRRDEVRRFFATDPDAAFELLTIVIRRARNLTRVAGGLALLDVYGRLARTLLDIATPGPDGPVIRGRVTHQDLATRVGATREMVSRILSDMRDSGAISMTGDGILLARDLSDPRPA